MDILDQTTDKSLACAVKLAAQLNDRNLASKMLYIAQVHKTPHIKTANACPALNRFPMCSKQDVMLSRMYFNGQREKIASDVAEAIDKEIKKYEELYGVKEDWSTKPITKVASTDNFELLPGYTVQGVQGLRKAEHEFNIKYASLSIEDRTTFAGNFIKAAAEVVYFPEESTLLDVYNADRDCDKGVLTDQLVFRKVAMERMGKDGSAYTDLATQLADLDLMDATKEEKIALASYIEDLDKTAGLDDPRFDSKLPDAWRIVFNKKAEDMSAAQVNTKDKASSMSKADVIARYGSGALDAVEDYEGNIDCKKLEAVMKHFGTNNGK